MVQQNVIRFFPPSLPGWVFCGVRFDLFGFFVGSGLTYLGFDLFSGAKPATPVFGTSWQQAKAIDTGGGVDYNFSVH